MNSEEEGEVLEEMSDEEGPENSTLKATTDASPEISLNSVLGINTPKTLKMKGNILGKEVVVMIDPGATHNFISLATVSKLSIPLTPQEDSESPSAPEKQCTAKVSVTL